MLLAIPSVLDAAQVANARAVVEAGEWRDGKVTAGIQSALAKNNLQMANESDEARRVGQVILDALASNGLFQSAALPRRIVPPLFNRYDAASGHHFGEHVDNALRPLPGGGRVRTAASMSSNKERCESSRTIDSIQKNDASRVPRVTGSTR